MPNRFGVRHAILAALLLALVVSVWMNMLQLDRVWVRLGEVRATQTRLEESVVRLERQVAEGTRSTASTPTGSPTPLPVQAASDKPDWARPGVPVFRTKRPDWINDPTSQPDYQAGGVITIGLESKLTTITPYVGVSAVGRRVLDLAQERLADYHPKTLELQGVLAEAWQMDPAGLWLRVKIRDDAVWSDGQPVSAEDIRFTIDLLRDPKSGAARFASQFEAVESVTAISPKAVEVVFREALSINESGTLRLVPLPSHVYSKLTPEQFKASTGVLVGTGPYMLPSLDLANQWTPDRPLELVRNPRWRGVPRPADAYRFATKDSPAARLAAIQNAEVEIIRGTPEHATLLRSSPSGEVTPHVWNTLSNGPFALVWNCATRPDGETSPCANPRVRLALTHALDRERMRRDLFGGLGDIATGPFLPAVPAYDPAIKPWPYDLNAAGTLLEQAGWKLGEGGKRFNTAGKPLVIRIICPSTLSNPEGWSTYLRDQAAAIGAQCTVDIIDSAAFQSAAKKRDFDGLAAAWTVDSPVEPSPRQRYHTAGINGGDNDGQWSNKEADDLIDKARRTLDPEKRADVWRAFHRLIHREQPSTFIVTRPLVMLVSNRLGNVHEYPMGMLESEFYIRKQTPK